MGNQLESIPSNQNLSTPQLDNYLSDSSQLPTYESKFCTFSAYSSSTSSQASPQPSHLKPTLTPRVQTPVSPQTLVSTKIVRIAADFWNSQMVALSYKQQLEVGVAIYLGMVVKDNRMNKIFKRHFRAKDENVKIETISLKFVNMMGWLIRTLLRNDDNLTEMLSALGAIHRNMGVNMNHFGVMLESLHETFSYYFPNSYKIQEKYAINYTFDLATKLMMGHTVKHEEDDNYLQSLDVCLKSSVGREYLFKFLQQTWCDEIAIYLQAIMKFKNQTTDKGRFMIARNIIEVSIDPKSNLSLNIAYKTRLNMLTMMNHFENKFALQEDFQMNSDVFKDVTFEVYNLIVRNHWKKFVKNIKNMNDNNSL